MTDALTYTASHEGLSITADSGGVLLRDGDRDSLHLDWKTFAAAFAAAERFKGLQKFMEDGHA